MTVPFTRPLAPPLSEVVLTTTEPPRVDEPPLMVSVKLGARIDAPPIFVRSPNEGGSVSGPCIVTPPLKVMLFVAVASVMLSVTIRPWMTVPPAKDTWLGASTRTTPWRITPALNRGFVPALMRMFDSVPPATLPVTSVSLPTRYWTNGAGSTVGNSGLATPLRIFDAQVAGGCPPIVVLLLPATVPVALVRSTVPEIVPEPAMVTGVAEVESDMTLPRDAVGTPSTLPLLTVSGPFIATP